MKPRWNNAWVALLLLLAVAGRARGEDAVAVDRSGHRPDSGVAVRSEEGRLTVEWPASGDETGRLVLDLRPGAPRIEGLGFSGKPPILKGVDPVTFMTVGERDAPPNRPPSMSVFNVFFDSPAKRSHRSYRSRLDLKSARVTSHGRSTTVALGDLTIGPFSGTLELTVHAGARLVHVEAVVVTKEERRAFLYDTGLAAESPGWDRSAWTDAEGRPRAEPIEPKAADRPIAVRHRAIALQAGFGSVACFPPPHQYFFPRDYTDNQATIWLGRDHRGLDGRYGVGIRQTETGGGNYVPWFNAPPGTEQRLGVFYLLDPGPAEEALRAALRFTRGDRFEPIPGHLTFTSHWHMAIAVAAQCEVESHSPRTTPDFVGMFKAMGVNMVHLGEFHGDGNQKDPGPRRLPQMQALFDECRRLSDDSLLMIPGEEVDEFLGISAPRQHPGHWMSLFPRPVYWTMRRGASEPFSEAIAPYGTVYHVRNRADMVRLIEAEHALVWTAHPRIKASSWAPDAFRDEDFFKADYWLGAAWKAMPADLSRPRLGERALDLLGEMDNWGRKKYLVGEVDVFKIDRTHELFGHMNINYVRLDRLPRFDEGWRPLLDALRAGRFFTTTGEVLLRDFRVDGHPSGETARPTGGTARAEFSVEWTFPPRFAELVSGDGARVYRDRIDLSDAGPFDRRDISRTIDLSGRTWVRLEAWDVAGNGAFTPPVWIEHGR